MRALVYSRGVDVTSDGTLDLQTAADQLGVHYQTAYRWVRSGRLAAELVGGRYLVRQGDVAELDRRRRLPKRPPPPKASRLEHSADRMYDALMNGDEAGAVKLARRLTDEGASVIDLICVVLVPPMRRIGEAWYDGHLPVWVEHRASAIVERLLGDLASNPRGRRRGVAAVAALSGDRHSLPTTMAAVALRADNWHVHHLGADLPPEDLADFCEAHQVGLAVITVTNPDTRELAEATGRTLRSRGTPAIVGGRGSDLADLVDLARRAVSEGAIGASTTSVTSSAPDGNK